jgi:thiamine monophosphate synthase
VDGVTAGTGLDYFVLGTVFETPSHPGRGTLVGLDGLARVAAATALPVLAIGGIEEGRLAEVARHGAAGVAAIRLFFRPPEGWAGLGRRVARWRRMFDIARADFLT